MELEEAEFLGDNFCIRIKADRQIGTPSYHQHPLRPASEEGATNSQMDYKETG